MKCRILVLHAVDMTSGVEACDDGNDTTTVKVLSNALEMVPKRGHGTRLLHLTLGVVTPEARAPFAVTASDRPSVEALVDAK